MLDRFSVQSGLVPIDRLCRYGISVIGVGAVGRQVALQLASIGVRRMQLIDFDTVEPKNVTSQGYLATDVGTTKVLATTLAIQRIDPTIEIDMIIDRFRAKQQTGKVVFCCVDSITARTAIWRSIRHRADTFIDGRMLGEILRVLVVNDALTADYYATTLFAATDAQQGAQFETCELISFAALPC